MRKMKSKTLVQLSLLLLVLSPAIIGCGGQTENTVVTPPAEDVQAEIEAVEQRMLEEEGP
ncbi:secreted protein [Rhodopirellula sallentina SM41]|uniref:Secreted protein n=2 Tax=Rhodopirellula TaxID=265488 RepID=M5UQ80_9BACT|nr:secreted protein [Rhodopirellula sallentina SM41]